MLSNDGRQAGSCAQLAVMMSTHCVESSLSGGRRGTGLWPAMTLSRIAQTVGTFVYGRALCEISHITIPKLYTSICVVYSRSPRSTSGACHSKVPTFLVVVRLVCEGVYTERNHLTLS